MLQWAIRSPGKYFIEPTKHHSGDCQAQHDQQHWQQTVVIALSCRTRMAAPSTGC
jgi:hypothetical protein